MSHPSRPHGTREMENSNNILMTIIFKMKIHKEKSIKKKVWIHIRITYASKFCTYWYLIYNKKDSIVNVLL